MTLPQLSARRFHFKNDTCTNDDDDTYANKETHADETYANDNTFADDDHDNCNYAYLMICVMIKRGCL